jgi:hypothetical protein
MRSRAATRCPRCGATVSPFAAGCAICGTDLVAARARRERRGRLTPRISMPALGHDARNAALLLAIVALLVVFASPIGILLALYCAWDRNRGGADRLRDALLALAVLGVVFIALPSLNPVDVLYRL